MMAIVPWILIALGFVAGLATEWIRNLPSNRERGTQHIYLAGKIVQATAFGLAIALFVNRCGGLGQ